MPSAGRLRGDATVAEVLVVMFRGPFHIRRRMVGAFALLLALAADPSNAGSGAQRLPHAGPALAVLGLHPTVHPPVPPASLVWYVPEERFGASSDRKGPSGFAWGVQLIKSGDFAQALLLVDPAALHGTALAPYAEYYTGLIQVRQSQLAEARGTLSGLRAKKPEGYVLEAATLLEAEAAEAQGEHAGAARLYADLAGRKTTAPEEVLFRLGRALVAAGDRKQAASAWTRLVQELPSSAQAGQAILELERLTGVEGASAAAVRRLRLAWAERLFEDRQYREARAAFDDSRVGAPAADRSLIALRLAQCDYHLGRYARARAALLALLKRDERAPETQYYYAMTLLSQGRKGDYVTRIGRLAKDFPKSPWAEEGLNGLASHYLREDEDEKADGVFRELYQKFPEGRHAQRAAWKIGWRAYRQRRLEESARTFERAAAAFPRSDYRPAFIYWAGRAREQLGDTALAHAHYDLGEIDYRYSYYGRLSSELLNPTSRTPISAAHAAEISRAAAAAVGTTGDAPDGAPAWRTQRIPTEPVIRALLSVDLFDEAMSELAYARRNWGDAPAIRATLAWVHHQRGDLRAAINHMKRAYPQYLASGHDELPKDVLEVLFPLRHWDLIRQYAAAHDLDPYLMAALIAQESTFNAEVRSSANAYGLMQIIPGTGRRLARSLGITRFSTRMLMVPETNIRLGMSYFASLMRQFGGAHYALAGYNAGEHRVVRWRSERPGLEDAEFIDDIPFPETQNYVKKVLGTAEDYRRLYGAGS